ncbi:cytoskeleton-associated protein 2 [Pelodytes ibericus]
MAKVATGLPSIRRLQPQCRDQRRKVEQYLSKNMSSSNLLPQNKQPLTRSPLTETANRIPLQSRTVILKPAVHKMQTNNENERIRSTRSKSDGLNLQNHLKKVTTKTDTMKEKSNTGVATFTKTEKRKGQSMTFSQSYLQTKNLKERQKDEKLTVEPMKDAGVKPSKSVLGAYRGKIIQSKINSFRNAPVSTEGKNEGKSGATANKNSGRNSKTIQVLKSASATESNNLTISKKNSQVRPPTSVIKNKPAPVLPNRPTSSFVHRKLESTVTQKPNPVKYGSLAQKPEGLNKRKTHTVMEKPIPVPPASKLAQPITTGNKYSRPTESAEQRKARLAEWRAAKGKVMKRPPISVVMASTNKVQKEVPEIKIEPEPPKEITKPHQLFWAAMAEEDEQEQFTQKVHQIFAECQKLIDEECPKEDILAILDKHIQSVPEAKKFSKYWVCLARLEQREGQVEKVIATCEEAVAAGAQPLDEVRSILADALENLKASSDCGNNITQETLHSKEPVDEEKPKNEIKSELAEKEDDTAIKKRNGRKKPGRSVKKETKVFETQEAKKKPAELLTPENRNDSTVIRFNVRSTPRLQKMKTEIEMDECNPTFKEFKFITPVRRSYRIERNSNQLPDMLKDHDPCVSGIAQLEELESCPSAYIFRKNQALHQVTVNSVPVNGRTKHAN